MQIIWDPAAAEQLKQNQTVLELETFVINEQPLTAYCVIPAEKVFPVITQLDAIVELHKSFIAAFNEKNYQLCQDLAPNLMGNFDGELDSFYQAILDKINTPT